ncbi:MAG TPA: hypothetical protein VM223_20470 [Planctomycetota bacterium]|nr:hypothetical protein [Planctomycetota bacterium]
MADITFFCLLCGKRNDAPAALAGRKVQCRYCRRPVLVPEQAFITDHERAGMESDASVPSAPPPDFLPGAGAASPAAAQPEPPISREERREMLTSTTAWAISLVIHLLLFLGFAGATFFGLGSGRGDGTDGGSGRKVGIVAESAPAINSVAPPVTERRRADVSSELAVPVIDLSGTEPQPVETAAPRPIVGGGAGGGAGDGSGSGDGAGSGAGTGGKAGFFGVFAEGRTFIYVVDRSGSMNGSKLDILKAELIESVGSLSPAMKFFIISYGDDYTRMQAGAAIPPGPVVATAANKRKYLKWVRSMESGGLTNPVDAMRYALSLKPDAIWLMTDGQFNRMTDETGRYQDVEPRQAADAIIRANVDRRSQTGRVAVIHTICFWSQEAEAEMKRIASSSRGRYRFVSPSEANRRLNNPGGP